MSHERCANCQCDITGPVTTGTSGLYNPGPNGFLLCEECFLIEDDIIEDDIIDLDGTNVNPDLIARYTKHQPEGAN